MQGAVVDGAVAQDLSQVQAMWSLREHAPVAASMAGYTYKYDVSVPVRAFHKLADEVRRRVKGLASPEAVVIAYGHLADGNLHLNVTLPRAHRTSSGAESPSRDEHDSAEAVRAKVLAALEPFVFQWVVDRGGSISAEHGIGQHKRDHLVLQRPAAVIDVMKSVKSLLDPLGIMNPHKMLPEHASQRR